MEKQIFYSMDFKPYIAPDLKIMNKEIFSDSIMNLRTIMGC